MTINSHLTEFAGLPVVSYSEDSPLSQPESKAFRLGLDWDSYDSGKTILELFAAFLGDPNASEVQALLVGDWGGTGEGNDSGPVVEALVSARDKLPKLRALFLGEMVMEESEISWITQSDVSPLFQAFPNLEELYIRGGGGLQLGKPNHLKLRKLVIETGGMSAEIVREVTAAELPALTHLELWLGDDGYGNTVTTDDVEALLKNGPCNKLTYLGLRDDCSADETAKVLASNGLPSTVECLDLSLGALGDEGAETLLASGVLAQLKTLDVHFHYISEDVVSKLRAAVPELNADDPQEADDWDGEPHRYVAVGE